jgi:hypothetical protein
VGPVPLPPHERAWRHPSELAAAEREVFRSQGVSTTTRVCAVATGTLGLLVVGALVLTATPRRPESPLAVGVTTIPAAAQAAEAVGAVARSGLAAIGRFTSDNADQFVAATPIRRTAPVLATPVGDGRSAVVTRSSTDAVTGTPFDVQLASGQVVSAAIIDDSDADVVVVTIERHDDAHRIASSTPAPDDIVTVLVDPPVTIAFAELASVDAAEGTPVLDANGELIGLCTREKGAASVIDLTMPVPADESDEPNPSTVPGSVPDKPPTGPPNAAPPVSDESAPTSVAP